MAALASIYGVSSTVLSGCNGTSIAQDIVNWTPALESTAATAAATAEILVPPDVALGIGAVLLAFNTAANLVVAEAKAYLANPGQSLLQALQTGVVTFQQNVSSALLTAAKIVDPKSQQIVMAALNGVATVINSIFALILQIKGNTMAAMSNAKTVTLNQVDGVLTPTQRFEQSKIIADHYNVPYNEALKMKHDGYVLMTQEGF